MPDIQAIVSFPSIQRFRSISFTLSPGITPSVASLEIVPQEQLETAIGPLTLNYGATTLRFIDCRVDAATLVYNRAGMIIRLSLLDRRWRWQFGAISGGYNVWREPETLSLAIDGAKKSSSRRELVPGTERTPRQLCALCLDALGERQYDLSAVPNDLRPTVEWNFAVPAEALAALVARLGCRVVLRTDNTIAVVADGVGRDLPRGEDVTDVSVTIDPPEAPDELVVVCGPIRYQVDLPLEAVGLDIDGSIRPIEQLSYRPTNTWAYSDLTQMNAVSDPKARELARSTVFRWYRIADSFAVALKEELRPDGLQLRHILPLAAEQLDTSSRDGTSSRGGVDSARPAQVFGVWHDPHRNVDFDTAVDVLNPLSSSDANYAKQAEYHESFTLDTERGIVQFAEPVFRWDETDLGFNLLPAKLRLRTTITPREPETGLERRYQRRRNEQGQGGTRPQYLLHPEIAVTYQQRYDNEYALSSTDDNLKAVHTEADHYITAVERGWQVNRPESVGYVGLKRIELDGAIQQITWNIGLDGATTRAARNTFANLPVPTFAERQAIERLRSRHREQVLVKAKK